MVLEDYFDLGLAIIIIIKLGESLSKFFLYFVINRRNPGSIFNLSREYRDPFLTPTTNLVSRQ
jgi:hypothetical protein